MKKVYFRVENDKPITLQDLIDSSLQVPQAYQRLISKQEQRGLYLPQNFSDHWNHFDQFPLARDFLKQQLANNTLVDIGGGDGNCPLARYFNAATYINVDRDLGNAQTPTNSLIALDEGEREGLHYMEVKADMLDFVTHLADDSANFMVNGIDLSVINDSKYHQALAQELARATKPGGLIFGVNSYISDIFQTLDEETSLKRKTLDLWILNSFIYQKPE